MDKPMSLDKETKKPIKKSKNCKVINAGSIFSLEDINDVPDERKKELKASVLKYIIIRKKILDFFKEERVLTLEEILVAFYRDTRIVMDIKKLGNILSKMVAEGLLQTITSRNGDIIIRYYRCIV